MPLKDKLDSREFAILAEMEPPKGVDVSMMVSHATRVRTNVDAFVVPDMNDAVMRMSALGGAVILQGKGMETVVQVACRDRNRLALQADLLATSACGINNIMVVSGEDLSLGDHHEAKPVYDLQVLDLLAAIRQLERGQDMAGTDLSGSPTFLLGSTINAGAKGKALDLELKEMTRQIETGVEFFVTPPLFDLASIDPFLKEVDHRKTKIIPTVLLLKSVGMARYIDRHYEQVQIPQGLIDRIQKASDKARECTNIAVEIVTMLKEEAFSGVLLSTIGWEHKLPDILEGIAT